MKQLLGKLILLACVLGIFAPPALSQAPHEETLSGPDSREAWPAGQRHLFGEWGGVRSRLAERGVKFDLQSWFLSEHLVNVPLVEAGEAAATVSSAR